MSTPAVNHQAIKTTPQRWLSIIGIGADGVDGLSPLSKSLIQSAEHVIGGKRHLELAHPLINGQAHAWSSPMTDTLEAIEGLRWQPVVVLASGDPFHYGVGRQLAERIPADEMLCIPQPSAFSLAASRMGWSLQDATMLTLHGRALEGLIRHLHPGAKIYALSWDGTTPKKVADLLCARGFPNSMITVLEKLGGLDERASTTTANTFDLTDISALNTIAVDVVAERNAQIIPFAPGLPDNYFEHDGKITKRDVRAATLAALGPRKGELLWDIGLGAGSIAIEWLLCHASLRAVGFEKNAKRAACAQRNAVCLGTPDLKIIEGPAPEVLKDQEPPDAVFIGGGLTNEGVFETAWDTLRPGGRFVANAVTLESEQKLIDLHAKLGGELVRIETARAEKVGDMHGWRPSMPIVQWRVEKS